MADALIADSQFDAGTQFGFDIPFKFPGDVASLGDLGNLCASLYPTGRVWNLPEASKFKAFHDAVNSSFIDLINAGSGLLDSTFPDNPNFDTSDAALWESKLGLPDGSLLPLNTRVNNILRKLSYRRLRNRSGLLYIQSQLQAAGFNVYLYQNGFVDGFGNHYYKTPFDIIGEQPEQTMHGGSTQHGPGTQHGGGNFEVIANYSAPESYSVGGSDNLWATFFIAGSTITNIATIPSARKREFRNLVLKLKPAHLVAYLFINYV